MTSSLRETAQAVSSNNPFKPTHTPHTLGSLLNDVLLQVWIHLDDPVLFSQVNKRFYKLSQDTLWRAKWFMQRYQRYLVLFEAIARPKIFTPALLERLLRLGAPMSRHLVQLIQLEWSATARSLRYERNESIHWGRISSSAYAALLQHASVLHGDATNAEPEELDFCVFEHRGLCHKDDGMTAEYWEVEVYKELTSKVHRMFRDHSFMPLPLGITHDDEYGTGVWRPNEPVINAVVNDLSLAPFFLKNDTERLLNSWSQNQSIEQATGSAALLEVDGIINVSQAYVKGVFEQRRSSKDDDWRIRAAKRELFLRLDRRSALPFRLEDVITEKHAPAKKRPSARLALQQAG